ncbi:acyl-CoA-binding protein [Leeuwenhoekiella marinoflava]|uniref:Acyl-CoA-binding protein n=2 Tax=Leeuwenhoekiella marinoflava TaxID=988 RepID=A0A4Q0PF31_9FLAO|nr:acyl-CoA-binding protein [Leeuwenhoekiella marinoflava]RXG25485.1 acyl-CoA-binding protein [Leeuwenhoekiella marinoflava]SHF85660.1 Acyl-CoA-binding protein [Leeuwenhoekiella marinoflava DSM 3653]
MDKEELEKAFQDAARRASETKTVLPPDIQLLLYAHYKQGNHKSKLMPVENIKENDLRSAFKYNALIQIKGLSATEAKKEYIKLVAQYIPD